MVIADASPLIALARIRAFYILKDLFSKIIITPIIYNEVVVNSSGRPGAVEIGRGFIENWIIIQEPKYLIFKPIRGIHRGELEVISLAKELNLSVIIDEGPARKWTINLNLTCFSTLEILLIAKKIGIIKKVVPLLKSLQREGFRMSDELFEKIIHQANEK